MLQQIASTAVFEVIVVSMVLFSVAFVAFPLVLALISYLIEVADKQNDYKLLKDSALYTGRVWHTRFLPKRHAFTYPIFMFALDLEEIESFERKLWPLLPWIVQFRTTDHLKNGEGGGAELSLAQRVLRLTEEKTNNKFQPTLKTHRIVLLTHLCYYGYNFNPVSFYYVVDRKTNSISSIVGEVSNTPWTEMHCYILHPESIDKVQTKESTVGDRRKHDYSFPKEFHVSPFMEMNYWYDWSFTGTPQAEATTTREGSTTSSNDGEISSSITVINTLRNKSDDKIAFTAKLIMEPQTISSWNVAWQMIRFPIFCMIIQIWIHYQAALLFIKGIVYVPHPQGSETTASKIIAFIMIPFFAIRDYVNPKSKIE
jgi:DUF1365 family protein